MHDLIEHLPAVIYEYAIHPDGKRFFNYISPTSESILGLKPEDILRDSSVMDSIIHEDDLPDLYESSMESEEKATEWNWQGRMRVNGKVKWVQIRSNGKERDDGGILRRGIIQDITERKETAQESELRYQALVERLPIGIVIHNRGKILFANSQASLILGERKSKELIGTRVLRYVHPAKRIRYVSAGREQRRIACNNSRIENAANNSARL